MAELKCLVYFKNVFYIHLKFYKKKLITQFLISDKWRRCTQTKPLKKVHRMVFCGLSLHFVQSYYVICCSLSFKIGHTSTNHYHLVVAAFFFHFDYTHLHRWYNPILMCVFGVCRFFTCFAIVLHINTQFTVDDLLWFGATHTRQISWKFTMKLL